MLKVYTSQFRYSGTDRMDITAKNKTPFSPTWEMVKDYKAGAISQSQYRDMYFELMVDSLGRNFRFWSDVLYLPRVTLVCYCAPGEFCHRVLMAKYLEFLGAEYCGEV